MNETVKEWVAKAEGDYWTATRELQATERPNYDAVCFHAQQCAEKLMKAVLIHKGVTPPRIHDLAQLQQLLIPLVEGWHWPVEELRLLTQVAVTFRYPGESADLDDANQAVCICQCLRSDLLALLNLQGTASQPQ